MLVTAVIKWKMSVLGLVLVPVFYYLFRLFAVLWFSQNVSYYNPIGFES